MLLDPCHVVSTSISTSNRFIKSLELRRCDREGFSLSVRVRQYGGHIVQIQRIGYEKKMQPKSETALRTPMKRASKRAPTQYSWPLASKSLWP